MAIFGDLGKALGLPSAKEALPMIGTAVGMYFGGPMGASIGSGIGSLAGGKDIDDALRNAALAYGVTSLIPSGMSQSLTADGVGQSALNSAIYGPTTAGGQVATGGSSGIFTSAPGDASIATDVASSGGGGGSSFMSNLFDSAAKDPLLALSLGSSALGLLGLGEDDDGGTPRPYADVDGFNINVVDPITGQQLDLKDREQAEQYKDNVEKARLGLYDDTTKGIPGYAHGGAMYEHDKMGYDVAVRGEVDGPGTGTSDSVPARLSDGEFVLTAKAVRGAGQGDRDMGAARLYDMMAELEATA
jgi:hypothetical protein